MDMVTPQLKNYFVHDAALNAPLFSWLSYNILSIGERLLRAPAAGFVNLCFSGLLGISLNL